ncbi:MAG TPA: hypothetical protein VHU92_10220 [Streptosporangiaceae bacterium]|nr:hypothetical protein [Streptosporangiaceae bacterium]
MRSMEERLRGAFREAAEEVPPDSVPPLIFPARRRRAWLTREDPPAVTGRARAWAAVASSAVMVAMVVGAATSLGSVLHLPRPGAGPAGTPRTPAARAALSVPRYYVALTAAGAVRRARTRTRASAVVKATATGVTVATVRAPRPYDTFTMVTAARDDRTFVLAAERFPPAPAVSLYVLRIHPGRRTPARRAQLAQVPSPYLDKGGRAWGLALSPDGRQLAVAVGVDAPTDVQVIDLSTGAQHSWASPSSCVNCGGWLSWGGNGPTLAVAEAGTIRLLNTSARGPDLTADSHPVGGKFLPDVQEVLLTPDQRALVAVRGISAPSAGGAAARQQLVRLSAATGQPMMVLNQLPVHQGSYEQVLWTSASGQQLIVTGTEPGPSAGILDGHHFTPIPWTAGVLTAAW